MEGSCGSWGPVDSLGPGPEHGSQRDCHRTKPMDDIVFRSLTSPEVLEVFQGLRKRLILYCLHFVLRHCHTDQMNDE